MTSPRRRRPTGVALAPVSAAGFGIMPAQGKVAYDEGAEPVGVPALLGGVGHVGQALFCLTALERISAGLTSLLLYAFPALVVGLSAVLLRERPLAAGCVALALAATALTSVTGLVLDERLSPTQVAGGAVVLVAVAVLARAGSPAAEPEVVPA